MLCRAYAMMYLKVYHVYIAGKHLEEARLIFTWDWCGCINYPASIVEQKLYVTGIIEYHMRRASLFISFFFSSILNNFYANEIIVL